MATAAIKPSAEAACRLCRGRAVKTESQWLKAEKVLRSPKAPQNLLVNQIVLLRAEAWEGSTRTYAVTALGYNLVDIQLRSRIAQNILFHHAFEILKVKLFC